MAHRRFTASTVGLLFVFACCLLLLVAAPADAANCVSAHSGPWDAIDTWAGCGLLIPGAMDNVTVAAGHTMWLTGNAAALNLTVEAEGTLDLKTYHFGIAEGGVLHNLGTIRGDHYEGSRATAQAVAEPTGQCNALPGNSRIFFYGDTLTNDGAISVVEVAFCGTGVRRLAGSGTWAGTANFGAGDGIQASLDSDVTFDGDNFNVQLTTFDLGGYDLTLAGADAQVNAFASDGSGTLYTTGDLALYCTECDVPFELLSGTTSGSGNFSRGVVIDAGATFLVVGSGWTVSGPLRIEGTVSGESDRSLYLTGNTIVNNGTVSTISSEFSGAAHQTVSGTGSWSGTVTAKSVAGLSLGGDTTISGTLRVMDGVTLDTGTHTLNLVDCHLDAQGDVAGAGEVRTSGASDVYVVAYHTVGAPWTVAGGLTTASGEFLAPITVAEGAQLNVGGIIAHDNMTVTGSLTGGPGSLVTFDGAELHNDGVISVEKLTFAHDSGDHRLVGSGNFAENRLVVNYGVILTVDGPHTLHTLAIEWAGWVKLQGDLTLTGDFINDCAFDHNGYTVIFAGSPEPARAAAEVTHQLTTNYPTEFGGLAVAEGAVLVETTPWNNSVVGTLTNDGTLSAHYSVGGPGSYDFGLTGVLIDVQTAGTLSSLEVRRIDDDPPEATAGVRTGRYWTIATNEDADGYEVDLLLPHAVAEPSVCRDEGAYWDCAVSAATADEVTREGVAELSDWAVGSAIRPPVAPSPLDVALDDTNVQLAWPDVPVDAEGYVVTYCPLPSLEPGNEGCTSVARAAGSTGWTHGGAVSGPGATYYRMQGINGAGVRSEGGERVGVFTFGLSGVGAH